MSTLISKSNYIPSFSILAMAGLVLLFFRTSIVAAMCITLQVFCFDAKRERDTQLFSTVHSDQDDAVTQRQYDVLMDLKEILKMRTKEEDLAVSVITNNFQIATEQVQEEDLLDYGRHSNLKVSRMPTKDDHLRKSVLDRLLEVMGFSKNKNGLQDVGVNAVTNKAQTLPVEVTNKGARNNKGKMEIIEMDHDRENDKDSFFKRLLAKLVLERKDGEKDENEVRGMDYYFQLSGYLDCVKVDDRFTCKYKRSDARDDVENEDHTKKEEQKDVALSVITNNFQISTEGVKTEGIKDSKSRMDFKEDPLKRNFRQSIFSRLRPKNLELPNKHYVLSKKNGKVFSFKKNEKVGVWG